SDAYLLRDESSRLGDRGGGRGPRLPRCLCHLVRAVMAAPKAAPVFELEAIGSGKSTLLKLLDGLYAPTSGTMRIFGEAVEVMADDQEDTHTFHRRVGLVFQD